MNKIKLLTKNLMVWITQSEHHIYIKCPHQVRHLGFFPWGKVAWSWSQPLTPIIVPSLCAAIHQPPPPICHHCVDWHTFLPCNPRYLLLACQESTPRFSTAAFPSSQTQSAPCFRTFLHHEKASLKTIQGCVTSHLPAAHPIDPLRSQQNTGSTPDMVPVSRRHCKTLW